MSDSQQLPAADANLHASVNDLLDQPAGNPQDASISPLVPDTGLGHNGTGQDAAEVEEDWETTLRSLCAVDRVRGEHELTADECEELIPMLRDHFALVDQFARDVQELSDFFEDYEEATSRLVEEIGETLDWLEGYTAPFAKYCRK